jgi:hypothetical protein
MLSMVAVLFMHVPSDMLLKCEDYHWLKEGIEETTLFTPAEKFDIITRWIEHTEPSCFDNKDAND